MRRRRGSQEGGVSSGTGQCQLGVASRVLPVRWALRTEREAVSGAPVYT